MQRDINPGWKPGSLYGILPALAHHLIEMVEIVPDTNVLDLASGAGTCAMQFAPHVNKVTAIDISPVQIQTCQEGAANAGLTNIEAIAGDAHQLPFTDDTFDLITGTGALSNIDQPEVAMVEIARVLKPGGRLAFGDFLLPPQVHELWGCLSAFRYGARRPYLHYHQVMDLLFDAGFEPTAYRPFRWTYSVAMSKGDFPEMMKERYIQAIQDANQNTKQAIRLSQVDDQLVVTYDCFALVAERIAGKPRWECLDI